MGLDNPLHIAFLLVILLLVFGAKRLPELGRSLGTGMRSFKESISGESGPAGHVEELTPAAAAPVTATAVAEPLPEHSPVRPVA
jgi:sec-independent protein translocase protein TatA